ncbi:hypothetical protein BKA62DRAFT_295722 [Auriculariales sp. MPI-PUGE-AT-0066]|nr:hypothetical protein BKA62DRAFT_295722 [Auriculariales sp. MPI-PUGE-AT-0066]
MNSLHAIIEVGGAFAIGLFWAVASTLFSLLGLEHLLKRSPRTPLSPVTGRRQLRAPSPTSGTSHSSRGPRDSRAAVQSRVHTASPQRAHNPQLEIGVSRHRDTQEHQYNLSSRSQRVPIPETAGGGSLVETASDHGYRIAEILQGAATHISGSGREDNGRDSGHSSRPPLGTRQPHVTFDAPSVPSRLSARSRSVSNSRSDAPHAAARDAADARALGPHSALFSFVAYTLAQPAIPLELQPSIHLHAIRAADSVSAAENRGDITDGEVDPLPTHNLSVDSPVTLLVAQTIALPAIPPTLQLPVRDYARRRSLLSSPKSSLEIPDFTSSLGLVHEDMPLTTEPTLLHPESTIQRSMPAQTGTIESAVKHAISPAAVPTNAGLRSPRMATTNIVEAPPLPSRPSSPRARSSRSPRLRPASHVHEEPSALALLAAQTLVHPLTLPSLHHPAVVRPTRPSLRTAISASAIVITSPTPVQESPNASPLSSATPTRPPTERRRSWFGSSVPSAASPHNEETHLGRGSASSRTPSPPAGGSRTPLSRTPRKQASMGFVVRDRHSHMADWAQRSWGSAFTEPTHQVTEQRT